MVCFDFKKHERQFFGDRADEKPALIAERDEALTLLRRSLWYIPKWEGTMHSDIRAFLHRIDKKDQ